jgi:predicted DNA-binding transcriptional regulator YafY
LLAESDKGEKTMTFAVERIATAEVSGSQFQYPPGFSPQKHLDGAFGIFTSKERKNVIVLFDENVKENVSSRQWHPSQKIEILKNGKLKLTMRVGNMTQVAPWILSYGQLAQVIEPSELKAKIKTNIKEMSKKYRIC